MSKTFPHSMNQIDSAICDKLHSACIQPKLWSIVAQTEKTPLGKSKNCLNHWCLEFGYCLLFGACYFFI